MTIKTAPAGEGWDWIVKGWEIFKKNPGILIIHTVFLLVIMGVANFIPFAGHIALTLMFPVLIAGFFNSIRRLEQGQEIDIPMLFEGFRQKTKTGPLVVLGAMILLGHVAVAIVSVAFIGGSIFMSGMAGNMQMSGAQDFTAFGLGALVGLLIILVLLTIIIMASFYAIPLIWFENHKPLDAAKASYHACMKNMASTFVFGLVILVLSILAMIPMGVGILILFPVSFCAIYVSYISIFSKEGPESPEEPEVLSNI